MVKATAIGADGRPRSVRVPPRAAVDAGAVAAELLAIAEGLTLAVRSGAMTPARAYALGLAAAAVQCARRDWRAEQGLDGATS